MHSTQNPKQTDGPHDVLVVAPDVVLVAPRDEELAKLAHTLRHPLNPHTRTGADPGGSTVPPIDTTFRAAAVRGVQVTRKRPPIGRRAVRAFAGFLLVACIGAAGIAWQSYGDTAKQIIARWAPGLVLTSSPPPEDLALSEQANPPTIQASTEKAAPPQPAPLAQTAPEGFAPTAAALSPESAQLLQSMAADLATAGQEIKELRASIEQLKASQEQMSRDIAKAFEQNLRPKVSTPAPRLATAPARKLMPPFPPPQAAVAPRLPQAAVPSVPQPPEPQPQSTAQPEAEPVLRPPMPVR